MMESATAALMSLILTLASGSGCFLPGAVPVIGTVVASGTFRLDNGTVAGNATLFEGAMIETNSARSRVQLSSGVRVSLGAESRARFYDDRMVLEKGEGRIDKTGRFRLEAGGVVVHPATGDAIARVQLLGGARVQVAALSGSLRVMNLRGMRVANVETGRSLEFEPQADATTSRVTGTLRRSNSHFLLTDETTNVTVELAGAGLAKEVGYRIEATGSLDPAATPSTDATQFIRVSEIKRLGKGDPQSPGAAAAGKGGIAQNTGRSVSSKTVVTVAIVGGVAAAATLGGLAAAGDLPAQSKASISR
jgi:hypothetical protein